MNIEEAKDILSNVIADEIIGKYCINEAQKHNCDCCENYDCIYTKAIDTVLNKLDKQNKALHLMAEELTTPIHGVDWIVNYYLEKVEENK